MLTSFIRSHRSNLAALAEAWLDRGAAEFGVWEAGQPLARWTRSVAMADEDGSSWLSQSICGNNGSGAQLRLLSPTDAAAPARLAADASLLRRLVEQEEDLGALTAELIETQDQLLALYDLAKATRTHLDIHQTLRSLARAAARLIKSECAAVVLIGDGGEVLIGEDGVQPLGASVDGLVGLVRHAHSEGRELSSASPPDLGSSGDDRGTRLHNVFVAPIKVCPGWAGGLVLGNKGRGAFPSPERKLARAIAEQAGGQIENVLLYQQALKKTRLEAEMELARSVQMRLLPQRLPVVPGLDIWAGSRTALHVGGDFYDFALHRSGALTFTLGDVSGKGAAAALLMSMTHAVFRSAAGASLLSPADIIGHTNTHLYDDFSSVAAFVTMFVGQYDVRTRRLAYANAGHSPVIYCPAHGSAVLLEADGPAVGVLPITLSANETLSLSPHDVLVVATDGFNEAQRDDGEMFGIERLSQLIESLAGGSAQHIALGLYAGIEAFAGGRAQDDDQTIMVVKGVAA